MPIPETFDVVVVGVVGGGGMTDVVGVEVNVVVVPVRVVVVPVSVVVVGVKSVAASALTGPTEHRPEGWLQLLSAEPGLEPAMAP